MKKFACQWALSHQTQSQPDTQELPAFEEPWQAQAYAMSQVLTERGTITPPEWATALGAAIKKRLGEGMGQAVEDRRRAYLVAPHGKPVLISSKP